MVNRFFTFLKAYFIFSARERRAVSVLLVLFIFFIFLPDMFPSLKRPIQQPVWDSTFSRESAALHAFTALRYTGRSNNENRFQSSNQTASSEISLFEFDPNTASADDWKKMGVQESVISRIMKYRGKGGRFREAHDLKKIYGLPAETCEHLIPYVRIKNSGSSRNDQKEFFDHQERSASKAVSIEINHSKEEEWRALPGIGPGYARRILNFREKLGGFCSIKQVSETYGLPDSVYRSIQNKLRLTSEPYRLIDLNTATYEIFTTHPYIDHRLAKLLIAYRGEHGMFKEKEEILKIAILDSLKYHKIAPYLKIK